MVSLFGLIAMAALWAPYNDVHCVLALGLGAAVRGSAIDTQARAMVAEGSIEIDSNDW